MIVQLAIRGFAGNVKRFDDRIAIDEEALDTAMTELVERHAEALANDALHMIEIEFLDDPNPNERFLRFGTDPSRMVRPVRLDV